MLATTDPPSTIETVLPNEEATRLFAADLAVILRPGDVVTLSGDLGSGKTTLARALVRALADDPTVEVPSPTFTLLHVHQLPKFPLVHADFYRLNGPGELVEIGLDEAAHGAVTVIEWPERAAEALPPDRLDIALSLAPRLGLNTRQAVITGHGTWAFRAGRMMAMRRFLAESGLAQAKREHLQGDASTRAYERLTLPDRRLILMNAPRRPDGPPVRSGLPYSAIAHLAEDVRPFVAMTRALRERGLSAPDIVAADLAEGLLVLEDFGAEPVVEGDPPAPIEERYAAAIDVLLALHAEVLPPVLPVAPQVEHRLPPYDLEAYLIEVELLVDWYLPSQGREVTRDMRAEFLGLWREAVQGAVTARPTWVLRDFHSPNLIWLPDREGVRRVGLLDFQDALMGPPAYDVASLLQDARVDVPEEMEIGLLGRYAKARHAADPEFDLARFVALYATMGAQRTTKILGIFARLDRRDHKPQYLRHLPRVWRYLRRSLSHPALAPLKAWYDANVPEPRA